jgi:hypothetical protein
LELWLREPQPPGFEYHFDPSSTSATGLREPLRPFESLRAQCIAQPPGFESHFDPLRASANGLREPLRPFEYLRAQYIAQPPGFESHFDPSRASGLSASLSHRASSTTSTLREPQDSVHRSATWLRVLIMNTEIPTQDRNDG